MIDRETATLFAELMKANAKLGLPSVYTLTSGISRLRCTYKPNMSYGRYNEPVRGNEEFEWEWDWWTRTRAGSDGEGGVMTQEKWGWRGLAHEGQALDLLMGNKPSVDNTLEKRFS